VYGDEAGVRQLQRRLLRVQSELGGRVPSAVSRQVPGMRCRRLQPRQPRLLRSSLSERRRSLAEKLLLQPIRDRLRLGPIMCTTVSIGITVGNSLALFGVVCALFDVQFVCSFVATASLLSEFLGEYGTYCDKAVDSTRPVQVGILSSAQTPFVRFVDNKSTTSSTRNHD